MVGKFKNVTNFTLTIARNVKVNPDEVYDGEVEDNLVTRGMLIPVESLKVTTKKSTILLENKELSEESLNKYGQETSQ